MCRRSARPLADFAAAAASRLDGLAHCLRLGLRSGRSPNRSHCNPQVQPTFPSDAARRAPPGAARLLQRDGRMMCPSSLEHRKRLAPRCGVRSRARAVIVSSVDSRKLSSARTACSCAASTTETSGTEASAARSSPLCAGPLTPRNIASSAAGDIPLSLVNAGGSLASGSVAGSSLLLVKFCSRKSVLCPAPCAVRWQAPSSRSLVRLRTASATRSTSRAVRLTSPDASSRCLGAPASPEAVAPLEHLGRGVEDAGSWRGRRLFATARQFCSRKSVLCRRRVRVRWQAPSSPIVVRLRIGSLCNPVHEPCRAAHRRTPRRAV